MSIFLTRRNLTIASAALAAFVLVLGIGVSLRPTTKSSPRATDRGRGSTHHHHHPVSTTTTAPATATGPAPTTPPPTISTTTTTRPASVDSPVYAPPTTTRPAVTGGDFPVIAIPGLGTGTRTDLTGGAIMYLYDTPEGMSLQASCEAGVQGLQAEGYTVGQLFCEATGTAAFMNDEYIGQVLAATHYLNVSMRRR